MIGRARRRDENAAAFPGAQSAVKQGKGKGARAGGRAGGGEGGGGVREGTGREGTGREGTGREGTGREGKGKEKGEKGGAAAWNQFWYAACRCANTLRSRNDCGG